ncbi:MAG: 4Fe-4S binding protein [Bacteroidia bacterium]|nr:4Fe-4S binding protein [Bacteroidia bacterium]
MKEILLISDKGGTGKSSVLSSLKTLYNEAAVFADCSFTSTYNNLQITSEEIFNSRYISTVKNNICLFCGDCDGICEFGALEFNTEEIKLDRHKCTGCGHCVYICPAGAIELKKIHSGKIIISEEHKSIFIYGLLQHFQQDGTRPMYIVRNKAFEIATEKKRKFLIIESAPGWDRLTRSLVHYANILVPVIEPHALVFDFLEKIKNYSNQNGTEIKLIITKSDANPHISNKIMKEYNDWEIICIPWNNCADQETNNKFVNFL